MALGFGTKPSDHQRIQLMALQEFQGAEQLKPSQQWQRIPSGALERHQR